MTRLHDLQVPIHKVGEPHASIWTPIKLSKGFFWNIHQKWERTWPDDIIVQSCHHLVSLVVCLPQLLGTQLRPCPHVFGEYGSPLYQTQWILVYEQSSCVKYFIFLLSVPLRELLGGIYLSCLNFRRWVPNCVQHYWKSAAQYCLHGWDTKFHPLPHPCCISIHSPHTVVVY